MGNEVRGDGIKDVTGILLGVLVGAFVMGLGDGGDEVGAAVTGSGVFGFGVGFGVIVLSRLTAIPSAEPALAALIPKPSTRNVIDSPLKPNPYNRTPVGLTLPY